MPIITPAIFATPSVQLPLLTLTLRHLAPVKGQQTRQSGQVMPSHGVRKRGDQGCWVLDPW